jgi:hypothetical protein
LYWINKEEKYAKFAFDLFDTYMSGMYYRKEPFDLSHGHHQTLTGLSSFEVIQEVAILNSLTGIYDFLFTYIQQKAPGKLLVYSDVFRKWADIQIAHGVAFNNWNLLQAKNVLNIAIILENDNVYPDRKGNQFYTNYILNTSSQRQWSLRKVINEGYDSLTGLWNESAGYSLNVLNDAMGFVDFFDKYYNLDLVEHLPVLKKAVTAVAQYLFPNGFYTSFGDSHYGRINLDAAYTMVANAKKNNKSEQERFFISYIKTVQNYYKERGVQIEYGKNRQDNNITALFNYGEKFELDSSVLPCNINEFITPVFSSRHVSLFNLRNGLDAKNGLMFAVSGSKGNHQHAGGISMEIYGKGYVLGPESGIGTNYFQADYAEYYSQFPAHNTVAVDGISAYPVMKSNHGFEVKSSYPASGVASNYFTSVNFGNLYFLEPETQSDQTRLISIIRTSDSTGYYVDIFRSRRKDRKDKMHDYFYHDLGQSVTLYDNEGKDLAMKPTDELSFGGGHLFAYDYFYEKKSITTDRDINAVFKLSIPGKEALQMNLWMKGEKGREIFLAKAPKSTAIDRMGLPKEISELPLPMLVARQTGEAWTKSFAVVFEPSTTLQPKSVSSITSFKPANAAADFVGLKIEDKSGSSQYIFSSGDTVKTVKYNEKSFTGNYAVISEANNVLHYLFLGNGKQIAAAGYSIAAHENVSAALELKNGTWHYTSSAVCRVGFPEELFKGKSIYKIEMTGKTYTGRKQTENGKPVVVFELPASPHIKIELK